MENKSPYTINPVIDAEKMAYISWINHHLKSTVNCSRHLPVDKDNDDLYDKLGDGLIYLDLLNYFFPNCISPAAIHAGFNIDRFDKLENLTLAYITAYVYGCNLQNFDIFQLFSGVKICVLEFLWQIFRVGLTHDINLLNYPELIVLRKPTEQILDLRAIPSSELVLRYISFIVNDTFTSFKTDFQDFTAYQCLMSRLFPKESVKSSMSNRIQQIVDFMINKELGFFFDYTEKNTANFNNHKMHYLTCHIFFKRFRLDPPPLADSERYGLEKERNSEFYLRNFLNSFGVDPYCNDFAPNSRNCLLVVEAVEKIDKQAWKKVKFIKEFTKDFAASERVHNAAFTMLKFSKDYKIENPEIFAEFIAKSDKKSIISLVFLVYQWWLEQRTIEVQEVIEWVNEILSKDDVGIHSFRDISLRQNHIFSRVLNKIEPDIVDFDKIKSKDEDQVKINDDGNDDENDSNRSTTSSDQSQQEPAMNHCEFMNYSISLARRCGYLIFTLPNQILCGEFDPTLMAFATLKNRRKHPNIDCIDKSRPVNDVEIQIEE